MRVQDVNVTFETGGFGTLIARRNGFEEKSVFYIQDFMIQRHFE